MVAQRILPLGHHLFIGQKQGWCNTRFSDPSVPAPFAPRCQNAGNAQLHAPAGNESDLAFCSAAISSVKSQIGSPFTPMEAAVQGNPEAAVG